MTWTLEEAARGYVYARARLAGTDPAGFTQQTCVVDGWWYELVNAVDPELLETFGSTNG